MPRIGIPELVIILVVVLIIFGAGKLPQIGGAMGKALREFRREKHVDIEEEKPRRKKAPRKAAEGQTKEQQS